MTTLPNARDPSDQVASDQNRPATAKIKNPTETRDGARLNDRRNASTSTLTQTIKRNGIKSIKKIEVDQGNKAPSNTANKSAQANQSGCVLKDSSRIRTVELLTGTASLHCFDRFYSHWLFTPGVKTLNLIGVLKIIIQLMVYSVIQPERRE